MMSYRKFALGLFACFGFSLVSALPEIRFDIHKTLVEANRFRLAPLITGVPELLCVAIRAKLFDPLFYKEPTDNQKLTREAWRMYRSGDTSGESFYHLFKKYKKEKLASMVSTISNGYHPMPGMQALVDELHKQGYTLRPASNIGSEFYKEMKRRNQKLFKHFQDGKTVKFLAGQGDIVHNPAKKPEERFYQEYDKDYPPPDDGVVFIDDSEKNCRAAQKHGWTAIQFKNAAQLRSDFEHVGIGQAQ